MTGHASILLCPSIFQAPLPPSLNHILDNKCNTIGHSADNNMDVPGALILHELLHWGLMTDAQSDYRNPDAGWVSDWNDRRDPGYNENQDPPNGYGPFVSNLELLDTHLFSLPRVSG